MKKGMGEKVGGDSPYAELIEKSRDILKAWSEAQSNLQACTIGEGGDSNVDPFALLEAIANIQAKRELASQIGLDLLSKVESWARERAQATTLAFDGDIRKLAGESGVSLDGRFPSYVVEGFLTLRISAQEGIGWIGNRKIKTLVVSRVWGEITSAMKEERLRQGSPEEFLAACYGAYKRAILVRNSKSGTPVPIKELFRELVMLMQSEKFWRLPQRQNFKEYSEEFFSRDLGKLIKGGFFSTRDGVKMELTPTAFAKDGTAVQLGEGMRIIGHVAFSELSR